MGSRLTLGPASAAWAWNCGGSSRVRRISQPTSTTRADSQNGIRQPTDMKNPSPMAAIGMNTPAAMTWPSWVPNIVQPVVNERRLSGACSSDIELALDCSPPAEKPCARRHVTSRTGAVTPIWS